MVGKVLRREHVRSVNVGLPTKVESGELSDSGSGSSVNDGISVNTLVYKGVSYLVTANWGKWGWDDVSAHLKGLDEELAMAVSIQLANPNPENPVVLVSDEGKYAHMVTQRPKPTIQEKVSTTMLDTYRPQWRNEFSITMKTETNMESGRGVGSSASLSVATSQATYSLLRHISELYLPLERQGYFATLGEALTTEGELLPDAVGAALVGGIVGTSMDPDNPEQIKFIPYKTPAWNVLVFTTRGVTKLGGRTGDVRKRTTERQKVLMTSVPDYARNYREVIEATGGSDIEKLAYVTKQTHPVEEERARRGAYGPKVSPDFIATLDPKLAEVKAAVHRSTGGVTFVVYDPRYPGTESVATTIMKTMYEQIGLVVDAYRTTMTKAGTRDISPTVGNI